MSFTRFAIYYLPEAGELARFGAQWLGWDVARGDVQIQFDIPGLPDVTETPRKYGFHGTLKPPFQLADGLSPDDLAEAAAVLASQILATTSDGLAVTRLGRFLALTPVGEASGIARIANACVADLDSFRAPPSEAELARRRKPGLSPEQDALLLEWGYPYVMDQFRFHMTLTGRIPKPELDHWQETVTKALPPLPTPFVMDQIALVGERSDGRFELIHRYTLAG